MAPSTNIVSKSIHAAHGAPIVVAAPSAVTASNPTAPAALTAVAVAFTWSAGDPNINNGAATIDDGATVGDDNDAGDALSVLENEVIAGRDDLIALRTEIVSYEIAISANIIDIAALRATVAALMNELERIEIIEQT